MSPRSLIIKLDETLVFAVWMEADVWKVPRTFRMRRLIQDLTRCGSGQSAFGSQGS